MPSIALQSLCQLVSSSTGYSTVALSKCPTENPDIRIFCIHPGTIATKLVEESGSPVVPQDAIALPAATILYLTSGKADYLSGRYVSANWDLGEVERDWKEKIVTQNALINKLAVPL
jgi:hypothetical protein